jgi:hypothetical protein
MSEHRPECMYTPEYFDPEQNIVWGGKPCICEEIKRAEKRVGNVISASLVGGHDWRQGYLSGLDAAREALAALDIGRDVRFSVDVKADALAAIDALREKP